MLGYCTIDEKMAPKQRQFVVFFDTLRIKGEKTDYFILKCYINDPIMQNTITIRCKCNILLLSEAGIQIFVIKFKMKRTYSVEKKVV